MTVLYSVSAGGTIAAADINQFKSMLEGASGYTSTYTLVSTAGADFIIQLGDAAGARSLKVKDSAGVVVWSVNSDGAITAGAMTPTSLVLPVSGTPAQTTSGSVVWDSALEKLTVANGTIRRTITPDDKTVKYKSATQVFTTDTTYADITASSGNMAFDVIASGVYVVKFVLPITFGGTGGVKLQLTGPAAPTLVRADSFGETVKYTSNNGTEATQAQSLVDRLGSATAFSSAIASGNSGGVVQIGSSGGATAGLLAAGTVITIDAFIVNGATAGTVTLQGAQNSSNSTTTFAAGCYMIAERLS